MNKFLFIDFLYYWIFYLSFKLYLKIIKVVIKSNTLSLIRNLKNNDSTSKRNNSHFSPTFTYEFLVLNDSLFEF